MTSSYPSRLKKKYIKEGYKKALKENAPIFGNQNKIDYDQWLKEMVEALTYFLLTVKQEPMDSYDKWNELENSLEMGGAANAQELIETLRQSRRQFLLARNAIQKYLSYK